LHNRFEATEQEQQMQALRSAFPTVLAGQGGRLWPVFLFLTGAQTNPMERAFDFSVQSIYFFLRTYFIGAKVYVTASMIGLTGSTSHSQRLISA
jgi:hypothetical protein